MTLTYRFDTTNQFEPGSEEWHKRQEEKRENIHRLFTYFLNKSETLVIKYWPSDFNLPLDQQISTKGVKPLQPFAHEIRKIPQFQMEAAICKISCQLRNIIFEEMNKYDDLILPWFYMELLDDKGMILLLLADHGEGVIMNLSEQDFAILCNLRIDTDGLQRIEKASINQI